MVKLQEIPEFEGRNFIEVKEHPTCYTINIWKKNKHTSEVSLEVHEIGKEEVKILDKIIKTNLKLGWDYGYEYMVKKVIEFYGLKGIDRDSFNGGRNRARYYFPLYHYPLKVLEKWGSILYFSNGDVRRLK